jgi:putative phosphoribosyl transferase
MYHEILKDRMEAGFLLSEKLKKHQDSNTVVLAIPRGGVPIGYEIAKRLHLPLDIVLSKKIGHPFNKEIAIGAASLESIIVDEHTNIPKEYIEKETARLRELLQEKHEIYRSNRKPIPTKAKNAIIIDDEIATRNTLILSIAMLRKKNPAKIIVAVPVLPFDSLKKFEQNTDEFIYLIASKSFRGVGGFYDHFYQLQDDEVMEIHSVTEPIK